MLQKTKNLNKFTKILGVIGKFFTPLEITLEFFEPGDISNNELADAIERIVKNEFNSLYDYLRQSKCMDDLKEHEHVILVGFGLLKKHAKYMEEKNIEQAYLYISQFMDHCFGKCYNSLKYLLSAIDGSSFATS